MSSTAIRGWVLSHAQHHAFLWASTSIRSGRSILEPPPADRIQNVWIEPPYVETVEPTLSVKTAVLFEEELALDDPRGRWRQHRLRRRRNDSAFLFEFATEPTPRMRVLDVPIAIRFAKDLLTPAILATDAEGNQLVKPDSSLDHVDITLAESP